MKWLFFLVLNVLLLFAFLPCDAQNLTALRGYNTDKKDDLVCLVFTRMTTYQLMDDEQRMEEVKTFECLPLTHNDDMTYSLVLPKEFVDLHPNLVNSGSTSVRIKGGFINSTDMTVTYPPNTKITLLPQKRINSGRKTKEGNFTVLVVRATEKGYPELRTNDQVREMIFDNVVGSFSRQMNECSFGKFNVQKAQGPGIQNGVLEVDLDFDVADLSNRIVEIQYLVPYLAPFGGEDAFDHVMYCIPYGTRNGGVDGNRNWLAYALVNHPRSVYNHFWCGLSSATIHEVGHALSIILLVRRRLPLLLKFHHHLQVGHNLGLLHSSQGDQEYDDVTGMMGFSIYQEYGPRSCFNARKNWHLGWFDDRSIDLTDSIKTSSWGGRLVAFVDYNVTAPGDVVLIQVGNLFLQYNRARDFNEGTREYANRVVIVSSPDPGSTRTRLEAALANNIAISTFAYPNFDGTGNDLVFKVCKQVEGPRFDFIHLSIHVNDAVQSSTCDRPLPVVSQSPSVSPPNNT
jgi:hypothetical protein